MKNISFKKISTLALGFTLLTSSCTSKFEEWNTNPVEATEETMQYDNLKIGAYFVQMQKNVFPIEQLTATPPLGASIFQTIQNLTGDTFAGYTGPIGQWFGGSNFSTYNMFVDWRDYAFDRSFTSVMPSWNSVMKEAADEFPAVTSVATIVKVEALHRTTDMYGPLPYLSFGQGTIQNNYDSQEDIYNKFFEELDNAIDVLTDYHTKSPSATVIPKFDFIFKGNVENWIQFANTLRLRLALRVAYAAPDKAQEEAEKSVNHPLGFIKESVKLQKSNAFTYRHPLAVCQTEFEDVRMGATMDSYLNGYNDKRLTSYFQMTPEGKFTGVRSGLRIASKDTYSKGPFSLLNISYDNEIVWMNAAEPFFLLAEGAIRGWDMGGTAQKFYEDGIRKSFQLAGVNGADAYIEDNTSLPADYNDPTGANSISSRGRITIKWQKAASFENKLERIITQKWIAIYPDGQEAWSEFRRTGYPKVFPVVTNLSNGTIDSETQVKRIPFSTKEYRDNPEGVKTGTRFLNGPDNGATKLWWDKK